MNPKVFFQLVKESFQEWIKDKCPRMGAALAYYTAFSLAPLLVIAIAIAGMIFGQQAAEGGLAEELRATVGRPAAVAIEDILKQGNTNNNGLASALGLIALLVGASGVFVELEDALNTIWEIPPEKSATFLAFVRDRVLSFTLVLATGFLLLVSLVASAVLSAVGRLLTPASLPGGVLLWQTINVVVSYLFVALLFAFIFKYVPNTRVRWRDVWLGAALTAFLFTVGKHLLGLYLGETGIASAFGAAGSLAVILVWVFFSAQILLLGAEFTHRYAVHMSAHPETTAAAPAPSAAEQGPADKMAI